MAESYLSTPANAQPGSRERALDGLRGVAILLVYLYHYGGGLHSEHIGGRAVGYLTESGWTGVVLFFVLSGFLITSGLARSQGVPHSFRNFYIRRALRILPLYYVSLGLAFVFALASSVRYDEMKPLLVYAGFLQNVPHFVSLAATAPPPLPLYHFWTLAVEEQFYLVWPALLLLIRPRRSALTVCLMLFLASLGLRLALWSGHTSQATQAAWAGSLPVHAGALALGAALALAPFPWRSRQRTAWWLLAISTAAYLLVGYRTGSLDLKPRLQLTLGLALVSVGAAALTVLAMHEGIVQRILRAAPLRWLGRISYGVYVFHILLEPLFDAIGTHVAHLEYGPKYQSVRFAVALPISVAVAALSFAFLEQPFLELKDRFPLASGLQPPLPPPAEPSIRKAP